MLEDEISDVIGKAISGLGLAPEALADKSGVSLVAIEALLSGGIDVTAIRGISPILQLNAEALIGLPHYQPKPLTLPEVRRIELPFGKWTVNAWLIDAHGIRVLFDTGFDSQGLVEAIPGRLPDVVVITHRDVDHVGGIESLVETGQKAGVDIPIIDPQDALDKGVLEFGKMTMRVVDLAGHETPAAGFIIEGIGRQVLVAGDAIFAGSMGRWKRPGTRELAFKTLGAALSGVENDCIILPGHGPATTHAEERVSNPFIAKTGMDTLFSGGILTS